MGFMRFPSNQKIEYLESTILPKLSRWGHVCERILLGIIFIWFGMLKVTGHESASSIIAKSVYWFDPQIVVPILGYWELTMGITMLFRSTVRVAILLLMIRLPGTLLALYYHFDQCFSDSIFLPTIQGQYLLKELTLVGAALVIAGTVRRKKRKKTSLPS